MKTVTRYTALWNSLCDVNGTDPIFGPMFTSYQANLIAVFPHLADRDILPLFRRTLFYQRLAFLQQQRPYAWGKVSKEILPEALQAEPGIILTAHTYSYRNIVRLLSQKGIRLCLLVSRQVYITQRAYFDEIMSDIHGTEAAQRFRLLDAEERTVLFKMRKALAQGFHILAYVDGNAGCQPAAAEEHAATVQFGAAMMKVRTGIFRLAAWLGCPLITVWTGIKNEYQSTFCFEGPYHPQQAEVDGCINAVYHSLEEWISANPEQWECFLYLDEQLLQLQNTG